MHCMGYCLVKNKIKESYPPAVCLRPDQHKALFNKVGGTFNFLINILEWFVHLLFNISPL